MKEQLKKYCNNYVNLSPGEFNRFHSNFDRKSYKKGKYLLTQGEICRYEFFIGSGLVKSFNIDENGQEQIHQFGIESWFVTNLESFVQKTPSKIFIQAVEDTEVLAISKERLGNLYNSIQKLEKLFRLITENMLIAIQRRAEVYLRKSSKERYEHFVNNFPNFTQRVPLKMIASYLDITPEYLSNLRSEK